jgi:hypothetical protein
MRRFYKYKVEFLPIEEEQGMWEFGLDLRFYKTLLLLYSTPVKMTLFISRALVHIYIYSVAF